MHGAWQAPRNSRYRHRLPIAAPTIVPHIPGGVPKMGRSLPRCVISPRLEKRAHCRLIGELDLIAALPARAELADLRVPARNTAGRWDPLYRSASCLEWFDEPFGREVAGPAPPNRPARPRLASRPGRSAPAYPAAGEPGTAGQDAPDRQHDTEIDALGVRCVVQPVVAGADNHPAGRAGGPPEIGVLECRCIRRPWSVPGRSGPAPRVCV